MKPVCALFVAALLSGCASIIQGKTQSITFTSVPGAATFSVKNRGGTVIHTGTTPSTLELARGSGYFKSEQYTVTLEKPGYASRMIELSGSVNGWYIGNVLLGGLIGMLIVDPITGAMYTLKPEVVEGTLQVEAVGLNGDERLLTVMLAEDLSVDLWRHAQRIPVDATNQQRFSDTVAARSPRRCCEVHCSDHRSRMRRRERRLEWKAGFPSWQREVISSSLATGIDDA